MEPRHRAVLLHLPKSKPIDIKFNSISYTVSVGKRKEKKQVLKEVSGEFQSSQLTAIMGPSGAGKSSLLNILTGFQTSNTSGKITTSDENLPKTGVKEYKKESCYILQDDHLYPLFTVQEAMMMAANLKLGISLSKKSKQLVIDDVLDTLGLSATKNTRCGRLSGGQKKRLSIALELLDNPPVMFLDEPTTGLDSSSSLQCISMLKALARGGRTIVCTIHQPSATIFEMFDHVYVLASGECVYQGSSQNVVSYFGSIGLHCPQYHNPADYMLEVVNCEYGNFTKELTAAATAECWRGEPATRPAEIQQEFGNSNGNLNNNSKSLVIVTPPSEWFKFRILLYRSIILLHRDWTVTHLKLLLHITVAILLGLLFGDSGANGSKAFSNISFCIVNVIYLCYTAMMPAVLKFPAEIPIIKKESFNNWYKLKTYYFAFLVSNIPVHILMSFVYTSICYYLTSQPLELSRYLMYVTVCVLVNLASDGCGIIIGTSVNPINGTFFGAILTCTMLVFAGFLVLFSHMPKFLYYVSFLFYVRYGFEALVLTLYSYDREPLPCPADEIYCHYRIPQTVLEEVSMQDGSYWLDVAVLVGSFLIIRTIGFCTLKRQVTRS